MARTRLGRERPTFAELDEALIGLGFTRHRTETFLAYEHAGSNALIVLPPHEDNQRVSLTHLVAVRRLLEGKGLVDDPAPAPFGGAA